MKDSPSRHLFIIVGLAVAILLSISVVPWSSLTSKTIKDFNLLEDLLPTEKSSDDVASTETLLDPEIEAFIKEQEELDTIAATIAPIDSLEVDTIEVETVAPAKSLAEAPVEDGVVLIENYSISTESFPLFKSALAQSQSRLVRIAFLGDSFIEGDIYTQDFRNMLQDRFGGCGVGYMAMHTDFPGFRKSVRQRDSGWKYRDIREMSNSDSLRTLSGAYTLVEGRAKTTFDATDHMSHAAMWERSSFSFIAPDSGSVTLTTDAGSNTYQVAGSGDLQFLSIDGATKLFKVSSDISGLVSLGAYLDGKTGVQVDCMSIRGNAGIAYRKTNVALCAQQRRWTDYDLIILEFGINALTLEQKNYASYTLAMLQSINRLKAAYPNADILLLGISDRGYKDGTTYCSLPTCQAMVNAQREAAVRTGIHFWDTRAAMGGVNSIVDWRKRNLVNADYIHLNYAGGAEMASLLYNSLMKSVDE